MNQADTAHLVLHQLLTSSVYLLLGWKQVSGTHRREYAKRRFYQSNSDLVDLVFAGVSTGF